MKQTMFDGIGATHCLSSPFICISSVWDLDSQRKSQFSFIHSKYQYNLRKKLFSELERKQPSNLILEADKISQKVSCNYWDQVIRNQRFKRQATLSTEDNERKCHIKKNVLSSIYSFLLNVVRSIGLKNIRNFYCLILKYFATNLENLINIS